MGIGETQLSPSHLEVGFACDDPALVRDAADFVADVMAFSEPVDTTCVGPRTEPCSRRVRRRCHGRGGIRTTPRLSRKDGRGRVGPSNILHGRAIAPVEAFAGRKGRNMALTGQDGVDVIRGLRAKGWSLRRIGKHPDVQLSAAMVHEILKAGLPLSAVNGMAAGPPRPVTMMTWSPTVSRMRSMGSVMCCVPSC